MAHGPKRRLKDASDKALIAELRRLKDADPKVGAYVDAQTRLFSEQLREAIRASEISLKELARRTGVDDGVLSRFMRGERSLTLDSVDKLGSEFELVALYRP